MSQQDLQSLLSRIQIDSELRQKFLAAPSLDEAEVIAREAGFAICKEDWFQYLADQSLEVEDHDLEAIAGGVPDAVSPEGTRVPTYIACYTKQLAGCPHTRNEKKGCHR